MKKLKVVIVVIVVVAIIAIAVTSYISQNSPIAQANECADAVRTKIEQTMERKGINEYTIADSVIQESSDRFCLTVDIPSIEDMDNQSKLVLLKYLCGLSEGFFMNDSGDSDDWSMVFVEVTSHGNKYSAYDNYVYYKNGQTIVVNEKPTDNGNYDKNDPYYSNNDYNNDGYLDYDEFQGAVGDYMEQNGY